MYSLSRNSCAKTFGNWSRRSDLRAMNNECRVWATNIEFKWQMLSLNDECGVWMPNVDVDWRMSSLNDECEVWKFCRFIKLKLNPLRARWPMEPALISGFCSVKRMRVWLSLDETLIYRRLALSRRWYSFIYPGRMESWVSLGGKDGYTNIITLPTNY